MLRANSRVTTSTLSANLQATVPQPTSLVNLIIRRASLRGGIAAEAKSGGASAEANRHSRYCNTTWWQSRRPVRRTVAGEVLKLPCAQLGLQLLACPLPRPNAAGEPQWRQRNPDTQKLPSAHATMIFFGRTTPSAEQTGGNTACDVRTKLASTSTAADHGASIGSDAVRQTSSSADCPKPRW